MSGRGSGCWPYVLLSVLAAGCGSVSEPRGAAGPERVGEPAAAVAAGPVWIDGDFSDWRRPAATDPEGDSEGLDLGRLWLAHDARFLFLSFEVSAEINLQERNDLVLRIDREGDAAAGLEWRFGLVAGRWIRAGRSTPVSFAELGLVSAPTVSGRRFEVALERAALSTLGPAPDGWRVTLSTSGDRLPDAGPGVGYRFDRPAARPVEPRRGLAREDPRALRILTYNVERDSLFEPQLGDAFGRILAAIDPDLLAFQEVYFHGAEAARERVEALLPAPVGSPWRAAKVGLDLVVVSRAPILAARCITYCDQFGSTGAFLVESPRLGRPLLLIVAHPPCCTGGEPPNDVLRQEVIDATMAFLRDARRPGADFAVPRGTPIVVAGDLNLVGDRRQLETLLTGAIVHVERFGPAFAPDWDDTALADLAPRHTDLPMTFTRYRSDDVFGPGRLDYLIYTDSALAAAGGFVLFTEAIPAAALAAHGLERDDTTRASDHLPVVGDFLPLQ